jgi:DNA-binding CsgD family transcriptional regulator
LFGIFRHERHGVADEDAKARIQFLAQHIRRAVAISRLVEFRTVEAASLADALDLISAAMILVDASGKVTHVNAAGQAMLSERDIMEVVSGKLFATDKTVNRELYETLGAAGRGDNALGSRTVSMTSRKGEDYLTHALPLTSGARKKAGVEYAANAAIFVRKAQVDAPPAPEVIAKLYGLTPSELRVLLAVFDAGGVTDIARMLGISVPTAKTHLRRLFEKTSTKRQADLVRLVAGYAAARA